jgi:hypothetical protein
LAAVERCDEATVREVEDDGIAVAEGASCDAVVVVRDVTEYLQGQAERFGEECGNSVVAAVGAGEDPADLAALIAGVRPMLDAPLAAGERVEEVGDVASSVRSRREGGAVEISEPAWLHPAPSEPCILILLLRNSFDSQGACK